MPQKTQFLHLFTRYNLSNNYDIFLLNTQLKPTSVLNILGVSFTRDLSWKDHIISLSKQASQRLGVLKRLQNYFTPQQLLALYRGVVPFIQLSLIKWSLGHFVSSTLLLLLTLSNLFLPVKLLRHSKLSLLQRA